MQELKRIFLSIARQLSRAISPYRNAVLIDNNVISYLVVDHNPNDGPKAALSRRISHQWWGLVRDRKLIISETVLEEASRGKNRANAEKRQALVRGMEILEITDNIFKLADELLAAGVFRPGAKNDATIIATCCVRHVGVLVTWNMRDLVDSKDKEKSEEKKELIARIVGKYPYSIPEVITPEDFLVEKLGITDFTMPDEYKK